MSSISQCTTPDVSGSGLAHDSMARSAKHPMVKTDAPIELFNGIAAAEEAHAAGSTERRRLGSLVLRPNLTNRVGGREDCRVAAPTR